MSMCIHGKEKTLRMIKTIYKNINETYLSFQSNANLLRPYIKVEVIFFHSSYSNPLRQLTTKTIKNLTFAVRYLTM